MSRFVVTISQYGDINSPGTMQQGSLCGIFMSCDCGPQIPVFALVETRRRRPSRLPADSICRTEWRHTVLSRPNYRAERYHAPANLLRHQRDLRQVSAGPPVQLRSIHLGFQKPSSFVQMVLLQQKRAWPHICVTAADQSRPPPPIYISVRLSACGVSIVDFGWGALYGHKVSHHCSCGHPSGWTMGCTAWNSESSDLDLNGLMQASGLQLHSGVRWRAAF